jgi:hypothetical protein
MQIPQNQIKFHTNGYARALFTTMCILTSSELVEFKNQLIKLDFYHFISRYTST